MLKIGIDLGGTCIKAGIVRGSAELLQSTSVPTENREDPIAVAKSIAETVRRLMEDSGLAVSQAAGLGLGCPGLIDSRSGVVLYSNNFGWVNVPFGPMLEKQLQLPVRMANDAQCAALGEVAAGNAVGCKDLVLLTIGTGVGSGIISGGKLLSQRGGVAGHMTIVAGGKPCTCGKCGCLEAYASATALMGLGRELLEAGLAPKLRRLCGGDPERIDGERMFAAFSAGDRDVEQALDEYTQYLAIGICNLIELYRPEKVLLSGGLCNAGEHLLAPIRTKVSAMLFGGKYLPPPPIGIAGLKNNAGIMGAAALLDGALEPGTTEGGTYETGI